MKWLLCILLASGAWDEQVKVIQTQMEEQLSRTYAERFLVEHIEKHPDVKAFIAEKGYEHVLKKDGQTDAELVLKYELQEPEREIEGIDKETVERLKQKYNLKPPEPEIVEYVQHILVERFEKDKTIRNVMIVTIIQTHAVGRVDMMDVGTGKLESQKSGAPMGIDFGGTGWPEEPLHD